MSNQKVPIRELGSQGLKTSIQGLGCMGMTAFYSKDASANEERFMETFAKALELGVTLLDTAWIYQDFTTGETNEELVGKALKKFGRENFTVATKCGLVLSATGLTPDSSREMIRKQCEESLKRLSIDYIDLYYQHRSDPNVPIEEVMKTFKELIEEGKIKYIGLSECTGEELRRAHAIHPVTAVQMEYSLQTRDIEQTVLPVARELGVAVVAYSPLGRGLLSLKFEKFEDIPDNDYRKQNPRFTKENFEKNQQAASNLAAFAAKKGCTAAQLALAWVQSQGIVPIPGTSKPENLASNAASAFIQLTPEEITQLSELVPIGSGERYADMSSTFNQRV